MDDKLRQEETNGDFDLKNIPEADFDGHTEFKDLTPEQRLEWLSQAVQFAYKYSKNRDKIFPKPYKKS